MRRLLVVYLLGGCSNLLGFSEAQHRDAGVDGFGGVDADTNRPTLFASARTIMTCNEPRVVAIGDLDGDSDLDLAVACVSDPKIAVHLNPGDGSFDTHTPYGDVNGKPVGVAIADLDKANHADLVVVNAPDGFPSTVGVFLNSGNPAPQMFPMQVSTALQFQGNLVSVADLNGDSRPDVVVSNRSVDNVIRVFLTNANGTLPAGDLIPAGSFPVAVAIGDVDADQDLDLVVSNSPENGDNGSVKLLLNNGLGSFAVGGTLTTGRAPDMVAVGDLNSDGKNDDLVVVNETDNSVSVFINNGSGTFAQKVYEVGMGASYVAVRDLDLDGKDDLVVTAQGAHAVNVLFNNGDGTFTATTPTATYGTGEGPTSVVIGDVNGDGKPDLVVTNRTDNTLSVLLHL